MANICERWQLPSSDDIRLKRDWNGHSTNNKPYTTLRNTIHDKTTADDLGLDDYRGSYIWKVYCQSEIGTAGGIKVTSPSVAIAPDSGIHDLWFFSDDYTQCTIEKIDHMAGTWKGWYSNSAGTGSALSTSTSYTISYSSSIVTNGLYQIYAIWT